MSESPDAPTEEHTDLYLGCGSRGDAIGHSMSLPEIQATGLHLAVDPFYLGVMIPRPWLTPTIYHHGQRIQGLDAVAIALGLSVDCASYLFAPWSAETRKRMGFVARAREWLGWQGVAT